MSRGRIQLGLILGILVVAGSISAVVSVFEPASKRDGAGVAFAQDGEEAPPAEVAEEAAPVEAEAPVVVEIRSKPHGANIYETHAAQTPKELRTFETEGVSGIEYSGAESPVAQTTEKIRNMDIARAAQEKYRIADEFLAPNLLGRDDPLEITDAIPEELRLKYAGEDISSLSDAQLEQLFLASIRANIQYIPIKVVGVVDNGTQKLALLSYGGQSMILSEGATRGLGAWPIGRGRQMNMSVTPIEIREDFVSLRFNISYTQLNGAAETLEPVVRNFYIRMTY